jgi:hypothetical protein
MDAGNVRVGRSIVEEKEKVTTEGNGEEIVFPQARTKAAFKGWKLESLGIS